MRRPRSNELFVVATETTSVRFYAVSSGDCLGEWAPLLDPSRGPVALSALAVRGSILATGDNDPGGACLGRVFDLGPDLASETSIARLPHRDPVFAVDVDDRASTCVTAGRFAANVWNARTGALLFTTPYGNAVATFVGKTLICDVDAPERGLVVLDATDGRPLRRLDVDAAALSCAAADGRAFVAASNGVLRVFDLETAEALFSYRSRRRGRAPWTAVAATPNGATVLVASRTSGVLVLDAT